MTAHLRVADLTFGYAGRPVLAGITLDVPPGSVAALIGPNGAGKTTLLRLAGGSLRPTRGRVELNGENLAQVSAGERARRIAVVPQSLAIPFAFTVREFVALGRTPHLHALRGERAADRIAIERALAETDTDRFAARSVLELSGGERQRAILALALAQEPELLLLDEPTANLDVAHQLAILDLVRKLNRARGLTVLAAIHDLNLAALGFDRLLALDRGQIVADGSPREVLTPTLVEAVFGTVVDVIDHPTAPIPLVALRSQAGKVARRPVVTERS